MIYIKIVGAIMLLYGGYYLASKVKPHEAIIVGVLTIIGSTLFNADV